jgi:serine/threonine protein kinase
MDNQKTLLAPPKRRHQQSSGSTHSSTHKSWSHPSQWESDEEVVLEPGLIIREDYCLIERLGKGAMGVVWKATDLIQEAGKSRDTSVAIKFLTKEFKQHPDALKALVREFNRYKKLTHPNIIKAHRLGRFGSTFFMVMEFLEGIPLNQFIKNNPNGITISEAEPIIKNMGEALEHAHQKGIAHLDFKPANVLYDAEQNIAKVIDFGIARPIEQSERDETEYDPGSLGALTDSYASCEMLLGSNPEPCDDIYGLACVTYELLSGKHPFKRKTASQAEHEKLSPQFIKSLNSQQNQALLRGLAFNRSDRTPTAAQFLAELFPKEKNPNKLGLVGIGKSLIILLAIAAIFAALEHFFKLSSYWLENGMDEVYPNGKIIGIKPNYREGDEVIYSIDCSDNEALSSVTFIVEDSPVKQTWDVSGKEINKQSSFSTKGWQLNKPYNYLLTVVDKAGNTFKKEDSFLVEGKAMSRLLISTIPSETMISFLNAKTLFPQKQEVSTLQEIELPAGKYHIEISKPGYESVKTWIVLENGEDFQVDISLPSSNILQDDISGLVFVWIPNCEFTSFDFDNINNCTSGFWMSKTEVSQKQWIQVMKSKNPSYYQKGDTYPVEYITWQEAKAFAARVNKRLCSPQEWQKAFSYLKKDVVFDNAILGRKTNAGPEPVDYGEKSELGVLNLIGNVRELLDNNGQAAVIGLYWAEVKTNSNFKRSNQIRQVFSSFKSSQIGFRLCLTQ